MFTLVFMLILNSKCSIIEIGAPFPKNSHLRKQGARTVTPTVGKGRGFILQIIIVELVLLRGIKLSKIEYGGRVPGIH